MAITNRGACVALWLTLGAIVLSIEIVAAWTGGKASPFADFFIFKQVRVRFASLAS